MFGEMKDMMKQASAMRTELKKTQKELAKRTFQGVAGGCLTITMNGNMAVTEVKVEKELLTKDPSVVANLIEKAVSSAMKQVQKGTASEYKGIAKGLGGMGDLLGK